MGRRRLTVPNKDFARPRPLRRQGLLQQQIAEGEAHLLIPRRRFDRGPRAMVQEPAHSGLGTRCGVVARAMVHSSRSGLRLSRRACCVAGMSTPCRLRLFAPTPRCPSPRSLAGRAIQRVPVPALAHVEACEPSSGGSPSSGRTAKLPGSPQCGPPRARGCWWHQIGAPDSQRVERSSAASAVSPPRRLRSVRPGHASYAGRHRARLPGASLLEQRRYATRPGRAEPADPSDDRSGRGPLSQGRIPPESGARPAEGYDRWWSAVPEACAERSSRIMG
jgi:hypothetical protein